MEFAAEQTIPVSVSSSGSSFSAKVPVLQGSANYSIYYDPPAGYLNSALLFSPGMLEGMSFKQRASLMAGLQAAPDFRGNQRGMVLGVQPKNLTAEEKQKIREADY